MAIIIPSKNIYQKQNETLKKNQIKTVEMSLPNVINNTNWKEYFSTYTNGVVINYNTNALVQFLGTAVTIYYTDPSCSIPETDKDNYIFSSGIEYNVTADRYYDRYTKKISFEIIPSLIFSNVEKQNLYEKIILRMTVEKKVFTPISPLVTEYNLKQESETKDYKFVETAYNDYEMSEFLSSGLPSTPSFKNTFIEFEELSPKKIKGYLYVPVGINYYNINPNGDIGALDEAIYYSSINCSLIMSIGDLEKTEVIINEDEGDFSIIGNEIFQVGNQINGLSYYTAFANNILSNWINGKETATIRCDINEYYNEDGTKAISINNLTGKMNFQIGDNVIPYVYGSDGVDKPLCFTKDGSTKIFKVVGTKFFYDGAVWQELSLQEI